MSRLKKPASLILLFWLALSTANLHAFAEHGDAATGSQPETLVLVGTEEFPYREERVGHICSPILDYLNVQRAKGGAVYEIEPYTFSDKAVQWQRLPVEINTQFILDHSGNRHCDYEGCRKLHAQYVMDTMTPGASFSMAEIDLNKDGKPERLYRYLGTATGSGQPYLDLQLRPMLLFLGPEAPDHLRLVTSPGLRMSSPFYFENDLYFLQYRLGPQRYQVKGMYIAGDGPYVVVGTICHFDIAAAY